MESCMHKREQGSAMIAVLAIALILNVTILVFYLTTKKATTSSGTRRVKTSVLNIAEAGKERLYGEVRNNIFKPKPDSTITAYDSELFSQGSYTVSCRANSIADSIWVRSTGREETDSSTIEVIAQIEPDLKIPFPPIRGAVTARSRITVKGNIEIDGRDYDSTNTLITPVAGTYGVSTCDSVFLVGSASVGGNTVAPVGTKTFPSVQTEVAQERAPIDSTFDSPEAFLGLPPGALNSYRSSDPNLPPFRGLIYKTVDVGPVHFDNSYGILIVHNSSKDAELMINTGTFRGLIIADKMGKIAGNAAILGAVVTLAEGEVSTFGTGSAVIHYSSQILNLLSDYCTNIKRKVTELSWKEVK